MLSRHAKSSIQLRTAQAKPIAHCSRETLGYRNASSDQARVVVVVDLDLRRHFVGLVDRVDGFHFCHGNHLFFRLCTTF